MWADCVCVLQAPALILASVLPVQAASAFLNAGPLEAAPRGGTASSAAPIEAGGFLAYAWRSDRGPYSLGRGTISVSLVGLQAILRRGL